MKVTDAIQIQVSHRFSASAERVFDAWLDPEKVCQFLFATPHGRVVRSEVDARVGGRFVIVDRRAGEDVEHTGIYQAIERPHRLVFSLRVPKYSEEESRVTIDIEPSPSGCTLTLTHEISAAEAEARARTSEGWRRILETLEKQLPPDDASCGEGLAQHAGLPAKMAEQLAALADTLELHREMLNPTDEASKREDDAYRRLATNYRDISTQLGSTATFMAECRSLPACPHDTSVYGPRHLEAFQRFVRIQNELFEMLRTARERDERLLASITPQEK
jgi:uncharacterized protein YndB with AHSA1/START domain